MAQYKQVRRNGRWIWIDKTGKEVKAGQGPLGEAGKGLMDLARQGRDMVVYSDKPGPGGKPQTIDEERRRSQLVHGPGGSPSGSGQGQARQTGGQKTTTKPAPAKPAASKPAAKPAPKPAAKPSQATPSQQTRTSTSNNTVSRATTGKPAAKPAGKVPASNAGMKNQDKNFRGNPDRKDSIASTLRELRGMGSGRKVEGVGPVASGSDYAKSKNETLKERMERMKKRRQGTSIGGVD